VVWSSMRHGSMYLYHPYPSDPAALASGIRLVSFTIRYSLPAPSRHGLEGVRQKRTALIHSKGRVLAMSHIQRRSLARWISVSSFAPPAYLEAQAPDATGRGQDSCHWISGRGPSIYAVKRAGFPLSDATGGRGRERHTRRGIVSLSRPFVPFDLARLAFPPDDKSCLPPTLNTPCTAGPRSLHPAM
jgi:hypothetical protein